MPDLKLYLASAIVDIADGRRISKTYAVVAETTDEAVAMARGAMSCDRAIISVPPADAVDVEQKHSTIDLADVWMNDGDARAGR